MCQRLTNSTRIEVAAILDSGGRMRDNRRFKRVPPVNTERADTLASMDRFEHIVANLHARMVIQHDPEDFRGMPKFPAFLD
jgi:N-acyl homoserine lactone hydrolase